MAASGAELVFGRLQEVGLEGGNPRQRAAHALAARSTELFEAGREKVRKFLGAADAKEIIFVRGTTEAINLVAQSYGRKNIGAGDEIIVSELEHHANIVPWQLAAQRIALALTPEDIFARRPDAAALAQFPERVSLPALELPVEYRFAPGESRDGATLRVPLLALPTLTRAVVDAAVPGLVLPRVEALLRSLPKDARRGLIPIAATAASFLQSAGAPSTNPQRLADWLQEARGIAPALLRFEPGSIPAHLTAQLAIVENGRELTQGSDLAVLRRRCAAQEQEPQQHQDPLQKATLHVRAHRR